MPKLSGRKAKKWLESRFSRHYVARKEITKTDQKKGKITMTRQTKLGGTFTLPGTATSLYRMGYGAMQLAGPEVWGPNHFGWFAMFAGMDLPASSQRTRDLLGWQPKQPGLIADMEHGRYFEPKQNAQAAPLSS
jgi:hypothetical protein